MSEARGFTLLELLVALAVFAVIAMAAYAGLDSVLASRAGAESAAQRLGRVQVALERLGRELEQASARGIRDEYAQEQPPFAGGGVSDALLSFTRAGWDNPLGRSRATLQRLAYRRLDDGLARAYWSTLDRSGTSEPREAVVLEGVSEARVRFLGDGDEWSPEWPPRGAGAAGPLPRAVELALVLDDWGEIVRLYRLPAP